MERDYLASDLPEHAAVRKLARERSDGPALRHLAGHLGALAITASLVALAEGSAWIWPAMAMHGTVLVFLFAPLHETIHRTAFRTRRLNDAMSRTCGLLLLLPRDYFRAFHFTHHRWTQDPARDPELAVPKPASVGGWLWHCSGVPYWRERITTMLRHARGRVDEEYVSERERPLVVREARTALAIYAVAAAVSIATGSGAMLWYWAVPAVLGMPMLRMYLLAEHTGRPHVGDMLRNSRTTLTNPVLRFLAWNMPYHTEHHVAPAVPFHRLPQAHRLLGDRVEVQPGYLAFHRGLLAGYRSADPVEAR